MQAAGGGGRDSAPAVARERHFPALRWARANLGELSHGPLGAATSLPLFEKSFQVWLFFFFFKGETLGHEFISLGYMRFAHHKERRDQVKRACAVVAGFFQSAELSGRAANGTGR